MTYSQLTTAIVIYTGGYGEIIMGNMGRNSVVARVVQHRGTKLRPRV